MSRPALRLLPSLALIAACRAASFAPGPASATLASATDGRSVYALDVDRGAVAVLDVASHAIETVPVGSEPTRLSRVDGRLYVTLRGERTVVAFDEGAQGLVETARAEVGAEPHGVVATADGRRVYVAVSLEDRVVELDGDSLEVLRAWEVRDEPRGLALSPEERALFVASHRGGRLARIDLRTGEVADVALPETGFGRGEPDGDVVIGPDGAAFEVAITSDPVVSADGTTLAVPVVYADTATPVTTTEEGGGAGYASVGPGVSRINPALVLLPLGPADEVDEEGAIPVLLATSTADGVVRSYPSSVTPDAEGRYFVVTLEASDVALVVDREPFRGQRDDEPARERKGRPSPDVPAAFGFWERPVTAIATGAGPRGAAFAGDRLYTLAFVDRAIGWLATEDAFAPNEHLARDRKLTADEEPGPVIAVLDRAELGPSGLSDEVERGRRLFYSAVDPRMVVPGGGVSCSTCHVDGRDDGRTWTFPDGPRQTPSLAGGASATAPFTWMGDVASVAKEASLTSTLRMGGRGVHADDLEAIAAFVDAVRAPDTPGVGPDDALVAEGRAIFERPDVGCASCHAGARFTDGRNHRVLDFAANTPSLVGVAATAPYLHDGSLATLRDVLVWARGGAMGDTSTLSEHELDALEAWLRSL